MPQDRTREYSALAAMAALQLANIVATSDTRHPNLRFSLRRPNHAAGVASYGCFCAWTSCLGKCQISLLPLTVVLPAPLVEHGYLELLMRIVFAAITLRIFDALSILRE